MQDRDADDLGDFLKLGLLRWLVVPRDADSAAGTRTVHWADELVVNWGPNGQS